MGSDLPRTEPLSPKPPPKTFSGVGGVIIFVGIAVMISLVWTQMQQAKQRGQPALPTLGEAPAWTLEPLMAPGEEPISAGAMGDCLLVVHFLRSTQTVEAAMMRDRLATLVGALDEMRDGQVRVLTVLDGTNANPAAAADFFAAFRESSAGGQPRHFLARPGLISGGNPEAQDFRHHFFYQTPGQETSEVFGDAATETRFVLIDGAGRVRAYRDGRNPETGSHLLQDLGALVREKQQALARATASPEGLR